MELTLCPRFFPPCSRACSTKILDRGFRSLRETLHFFVFKVKLNTRILSKIFKRACGQCRSRGRLLFSKTTSSKAYEHSHDSLM